MKFFTNFLRRYHIISDEVPSSKHREVFFSKVSDVNQIGVVSNTVQTARYNLIDFLPKQLFVQFSKIANLYFLLIGLLQQIPGLSPTGQFTTIGPLILFVTFAMLREAYDDLQRHRQDRVENNYPAEIWDNNDWKTVSWSQIVVGNIVRVRNNQSFPADILLLHSSQQFGLCYIETSSLDGESNFKERLALPESQSKQNSGSAIAASRGFIRAEEPNADLYSFKGSLTLGSEVYPLTANQLLLRGASLRNTDYIFGLVIYTGEQTKIRLNATPPPTKSPSIEQITNRLILTIFGFLIALTTFFTILSTIWNSDNRSSLWYLGTADTSNFMRTFGTFLILYNTLIPISLYVTLEVVKLIQAALIGYDESMFHEKSGTFAQARTSSINEELGQISYVFSDKTGTLTENEMIFRKYSFHGKSCTHFKYNAEHSVSSSSSVVDDRILETAEEQQHRTRFQLAIALCSTVLPIVEDQGITYQGSSPDEVALVQGVAELGYVLVKRQPDHVCVQHGNAQPQQYTVLHVLEFNSDRKRMSIIYRMPDGKIVLFCKGADSVIFERLSASSKEHDYRHETQEHINNYAKDGLRTLVYAILEITPEHYEQWRQTYHEASIAMENRQEKMDQAADAIERNLMLVGATAIEDKLQAGVGRTIESLHVAGIKVWVLTGDKLETAINVGYASSLIHNDSQVFIIKADTDSVLVKLTQAKDTLITRAREIAEASYHSIMVLEGSTIQTVFEDEQLLKEFLEVGQRVNGVICCRVSPIQKADVVKAVRMRLNQITLAIGDGANDISMIQAAHVGIGITGREGLQAARSSDYTIAQFRFLQRLLLVHGHWSYVRVSKFLLGSFYKCMAFYLTQAIFQFYTGYTGTSMYDSWTLACYNVIFALFPVIFIGIFEKDLSDTILMTEPQVYRLGRLSLNYNSAVFWSWMVKGMFHAATISLVTFYLFGYIAGLSYNNDDGLYVMGTVCYTSVIIVVTTKIGFLESRNWTWANIVVNLGSIGVWFLFIFVYSYLLKLGPDMYGMFIQLFSHNSKYLFNVALVAAIALIPDLLIKFFMVQFKPRDDEILAETFQVSTDGYDALLSDTPLSTPLKTRPMQDYNSRNML